MREQQLSAEYEQLQGRPEPGHDMSGNMSPSHIRNVLIEHFNETELFNLCHDMDIDYETLSDSGKADIARELVRYCQRHDRYNELVTRCRDLRPNAFKSDEGQEQQQHETGQQSAVSEKNGQAGGGSDVANEGAVDDPVAPEAEQPDDSSEAPARYVLPRGTLSPDFPFYIERPEDRVALEAIQGQGVSITVKGPQEMGKSSLLLRMTHAAQALNKNVAIIDFHAFDGPDLQDADTFFRHFCYLVADEINIDDQLDTHWSDALGNVQRSTRYVERYVLNEVDGPLVLALDEVDRILDSPFCDDFFGMLRSWHNKRARDEQWKRCDLLLTIPTDPPVNALTQSPFNVSQVIKLTDFTLDQIADLNRRYGAPLQAGQAQHLHELLEGHPALVHIAIYLLASRQLDAETLFARAVSDQGPFNDHLYRLYQLLQTDASLVDGMRKVLRTSTCSDERVFFKLRAAGLVRREGKTVYSSRPIYTQYFEERL